MAGGDDTAFRLAYLAMANKKAPAINRGFEFLFTNSTDAITTVRDESSPFPPNSQHFAFKMSPSVAIVLLSCYRMQLCVSQSLLCMAFAYQ